jgi:hypothetical protein
MLGSEANREAAQRRARSYELLYLSLGRERSIRSFRRQARDARPHGGGIYADLNFLPNLGGLDEEVNPTIT